ncbi:MAG: Hsp20 family protein [Alphaproteobacteria bacterium]|nr:Hsp20 family protein [Alphaproteobacteria bacterium]
MSTYDLTPLFRSTVGFDHVSRLLDAAFAGADEGTSYPPYNIEKTGDNEYRVTMAVAGFGEDDIEITQHQNTLSIKGKAKQTDTEARTLYRGIAARAFDRRFELADYVQVTGATLVNGLLQAELVREVPEAMKPRTIAVQRSSEAARIERKAA